jgi:hypothetical protein
VANWESFDYAFSVPASVTDEDLKLGYEKALVEARKECDGVDMSVAMILRTSFMIGWQIKHMQTSRRSYGSKEGYQHPAQEKDAMLAWMQVAKDYDEFKLKAKPHALEGLLPQQVVSIVQAVVSKVQDTDQRDMLMDKLVEEMKKQGV